MSEDTVGEFSLRAIPFERRRTVPVVYTRPQPSDFKFPRRPIDDNMVMSRRKAPFKRNALGNVRDHRGADCVSWVFGGDADVDCILLASLSYLVERRAAITQEAMDHDMNLERKTLKNLDRNVGNRQVIDEKLFIGLNRSHEV